MNTRCRPREKLYAMGLTSRDSTRCSLTNQSLRGLGPESKVIGRIWSDQVRPSPTKSSLIRVDQGRSSRFRLLRTFEMGLQAGSRAGDGWTSALRSGAPRDAWATATAGRPSPGKSDLVKVNPTESNQMKPFGGTRVGGPEKKWRLYSQSGRKWFPKELLFAVAKRGAGGLSYGVSQGKFPFLRGRCDYLVAL